MKALILLTTLAVSLVACSQADQPVAKTADRPNILLIVADDMGYSDVEPFGGEIDTPNIQSLADRGVKFTNFYVGPSCSGTRSMLLSGNDSHVAGLGTMNELLAPNQIGQPRGEPAQGGV